MKVPSPRALRRALAALTLTTALAVTGCSGDQAATSGASDGGGESAASDGGGQSAVGEQAAPEADLSDVPDVVATVNDEQITKDEFAAVYESQLQQAAAQQQTTGEEVDQTALKEQVANQLVDNLLLQQGAEHAGVEATDEDIDAMLEQIAQQNGLGSADEVVSALEQQGMSEEEVREDAATQVKLTAYVEQEADIQEPSEEELKEQYDAMLEQQEEAGGDTSQVPSFEEVRDQLAQQSVSQQQNEAAASLAKELRESGDVAIHL